MFFCFQKKSEKIQDKKTGRDSLVSIDISNFAIATVATCLNNSSSACENMVRTFPYHCIPIHYFYLKEFFSKSYIKKFYKKFITLKSKLWNSLFMFFRIRTFFILFDIMSMLISDHVFFSEMKIVMLLVLLCSNRIQHMYHSCIEQFVFDVLLYFEENCLRYLKVPSKNTLQGLVIFFTCIFFIFRFLVNTKNSHKFIFSFDDY